MVFVGSGVDANRWRWPMLMNTQCWWLMVSWCNLVETYSSMFVCSYPAPYHIQSFLCAISFAPPVLMDFDSKLQQIATTAGSM